MGKDCKLNPACGRSSCVRCKLLKQTKEHLFSEGERALVQQSIDRLAPKTKDEKWLVDGIADPRTYFHEQNRIREETREQLPILNKKSRKEKAARIRTTLYGACSLSIFHPTLVKKQCKNKEDVYKAILQT